MRDLLIGLKHQEEYKVENLTTVPYEDLSKWCVGEAVIKSAVSRWEPFGFLTGIKNQVKKEALSVAFDNMAYDLLHETKRVVDIEKRYNYNCKPDGENDERESLCATFDFCVVVFPILRRVICGTVGEDTGVNNFSYEKFLTYLEELSFLAINYDGFEYDIDVEAEFVAILSDAIIRRFNKNK